MLTPRKDASSPLLEGYFETLAGYWTEPSAEGLYGFLWLNLYPTYFATVRIPSMTFFTQRKQKV